jgi:hypothetical protein
MNSRKLIRKIRYYLLALAPHPTPQPATEAIDVVIPVTEKDLDILPLALEGLRRHVTNKIAAIYIVARDSETIRRFCSKTDTIFIDEQSVLGYGPQRLSLIVGNPPTDRSGWLFQQLLKLSGDIGHSRWFVVIDSDHVLLRDHTFVTADHRLVLYRSYEYHAPYYDNIKRLLGVEPTSPLSYVAHKMVFDRQSLKRLHADIESANPGLTWDNAIVDSVDRNQLSGFSEFELYGNWLPPKVKLHRPWRNHHLHGKHISDNNTLEQRYRQWYAAITFPSYLK